MPTTRISDHACFPHFVSAHAAGTAEALTRNHKPDLPEERERIKDTEGKVIKVSLWSFSVLWAIPRLMPVPLMLRELRLLSARREVSSRGGGGDIPRRMCGATEK